MNRQNESQATLASDEGPSKPFPDITPQNSNSKESYHGLFPLEQLLEQKSQTLNAQTSTFRATKVEDGINYCLKRVHGKFNFFFNFFENFLKIFLENFERKFSFEKSFSYVLTCIFRHS